MANAGARVPVPPLPISADPTKRSDSQALESSGGPQKLARKLQADGRVPHGQSVVETRSTVDGKDHRKDRTVRLGGELPEGVEGVRCQIGVVQRVTKEPPCTDRTQWHGTPSTWCVRP